MATETRTTCPYCGVGCGVVAKVDDDGVVTVEGDPDHPANFGRLCSKGTNLAETLDLDGRVLVPEIGGRPASWDQALDLVAGRFAQVIAEHGPDSVAFYVSGQLLTEDYYVANKLMKGFIGSANIDTNSRLCMASSVAGHRRAFGSDTVPGCYEDLELADLLVLVGSNMAWCHPVLYQRIAAAKTLRPSMKIVVIDPRRTMTCDIADLHLAIRPDGDVALFMGLLAHLAEAAALDRAYIETHTLGFNDALAAASTLSPSDLTELTGLSASQVRQFFHLYEKSEKLVTCYSQGVNQSSRGTDKVNAIINCHLATGRIGRPGMGPFSLTGQPNAMGGREVGGLANMLAAHLEIENLSHRELVRRFWNTPSVAKKPGLKAVDMFQAVADGRIKAIWIMSTNPVVSMPDADSVRAALASCPFIVVSDIQRNTDTARLAHVLLPAAGWGEKSGAVTNSERRVSRQRAFLPLPGKARPDWWQLAEVGKRMGFASAFDYASPADIFAEHASLSALGNGGTRAFDIGAYADIDEQAYDRLAPFQWPHPKGASPVLRFFSDGSFFTADGKARIVPVHAPPREDGETTTPFILNTGRIRDHWHTMTRTGKSPRLSSHIAEPFCEINPADAGDHDIGDADLVCVENAQGASIIVRALLTERQMRGSVFVPMHWTGETAPSARVDTLVPSHVDPISGQPALKMARVSVARYRAKAHGFLVSSERPFDLPFAYWAIAKTKGGYRTEFAGTPPRDGWQSWLRQTLQLDDGHDLSGYTDRQAEDHRILAFDGKHLAGALFVAPGPVEVSRQWVAEQLTEPHADFRARSLLFAGRPAAGRPDKGPIVCSCFSVGLNEIQAAVHRGCRSVEAVGAALNAGTNCGSCRPEIRRVVDAAHVIAAE